MTPTKQNAPTGGRSACEMNFGGFIRNRNAAARRMEPLECVVEIVLTRRGFPCIVIVRRIKMMRHRIEREGSL